MIQNPYVGPRAFERSESQFFFGRDEESEILKGLVMTRRAALFFAQSGAGKSSLLRASLIPELTRQETVGRGRRTRTVQKMQVLPVLTVGGAIPSEVSQPIANVYVFSALLSLLPDAALDELASLTLIDGMAPFFPALETEPASLTSLSSGISTLLIFDQFEELFIHHPTHLLEREDFFRQVSQALTTYPTLHVLFTMREDYIAELVPYANLLPEQLRPRFRMERLKREAALQAVQEPAAQADRPFAEGVAEALVDNLRRAQPGQKDADRQAQALGAYVEPVHLQIVCRQLWANLPPDRNIILAEDVKEFGDVDQALIDFYEAALETVIEQTGIGERRLRAWFDTRLITPAHTRGLVYRGEEETEGLPNAAVAILNEAYIVRANVRRNDIWYELAHDRLVRPILAANRAWMDKHQNPLTLAAKDWQVSGKDPQKLYKGDQLKAAQAQIEANPDEFTALEKEFVRVSQETARRQAARRQRLVLLGTTILLVVFAALTAWALRNASVADNARQAAEAARATTEAERDQVIRKTQDTDAFELAAAAVKNLDVDRELSVLLAVQAVKGTYYTADPRVIPEAEDALQQALQQVFVHKDWVNSIAFSPDGEYLATAGQNGTAKVWDIASGQESLSLYPDGHTAPVYGVAFSPDGQYLVTADADERARVWEIASGQEQSVLSDPGQMGPVYGVAFSPDGALLATASGAASSRDVTQVAADSLDKSVVVIVWDVASSQQQFFLEGHTATVRGVAFSPDGKYLATASTDRTARVWDIASGALHTVISHTGTVRDVAFSPDSTLLATAGADEIAKVWDVASSEERYVLTGHTGAVHSVAFSPDDAFLATGDADGTVRAWDVTSGKELFVLSNHADSVNSVAFSLDGQYLATAGSDNTARLFVLDTYTLDVEPLLAMACTHTTRNLSQDEWETYIRGNEPYTRTCPTLPIHPTAIMEYVRRGQEDKAIELSSTDDVIKAFLSLGEEYISQARYGRALAALDRAVDLDPQPQVKQVEILAEAYNSLCAVSGSGDLAAEDLPAVILYACERAVALAIETESASLNYSICQHKGIASLADIVQPACERADELATTGELGVRYIFGLHEPGGEWLMEEKGKKGWIVFTHPLGHDPNNHEGFDYRPWSDRGFGIIARLNHDYEPLGTIPQPQYYNDFAQRVRNFVESSPGCHIWVIGNEMNLPREYPGNNGGQGGDPIFPELYAECYKKVWDQIHSLSGHENDQVVVGAVSPWTPWTRYPGNENGDWVRYFQDILQEIHNLDCPVDAIALHTYTHGQDPNLVFSEQKMNPPFQDYRWHFRAYQDFMNAIPQDLRHVPVYITEMSQDEEWEDANRGWVQNAYKEINDWNTTPGNQQIRALVLYRWAKGGLWWDISGKEGVHEDFKAAMDNEYVWTD